MKISKHNKEVFWVLAIMLLAVSFSLSQTIIYLLNTPSGFSFQFAHNFIEDYYYYLHIMRQGWEGNYLATSRLTPEIYPAMFVVPFFLFLGHIARILNLSLPFTYTMARIIGGIGLIGVIYGLIKLAYPESLNKRLLALIFVCFGTSWWIFNNGQIYPSSLVRDWTELDPIFRLTFIPHHLWSKVFMILSFIFIYQLLTDRKIKENNYRVSQFSNSGPAPSLPRGKRSFTLSAVEGLASPAYFLRYLRNSNYLKLTLSILFMGFTNPVTLSTFLPVILIWLLITIVEAYCSRSVTGPRFGGLPRVTRDLLFNSRIKIFLLPFLLSILLGVLIALYHRLVQNSVFPWTSYLAWEKVQYPISIISYLKSLGPLFLLFLIGLPVLFKKQYIGSLLLAWVAAGFALLFIVGPLLPLTNSRYLGGYQFIPIGIGSVEGLWILGWLFLKIMQKAKCPPAACLPARQGEAGKNQNQVRLGQNDKVKCKNINQIIIGVLIIGLIGYFIVGIYASWRQQINYVKINQNNPQVYLPNQLLVAFQFLDKQTSSGTVILAPYYVSTMIPAFTGSRVVAGHQMMTQDHQGKRADMEKFFSFPNATEAKQILDKHKVSYVLFDTALGKNTESFVKELRLNRVFEGKTVSIYKIDKTKQ